MSEKPRCDTCRYWQRDFDEDNDECEHGTCRRRAPSPMWARTFVSDWCGEHDNGSTRVTVRTPNGV